MTPQDLLKQYEKAISTQAWENVEPLMHEGICVTFSTGTFKGKQEVQKVFEKNFSLIKDEVYSITDIHWACSSEDTAVCLYNFHWKGIINGQAASGGGRGTSVLVKSDVKPDGAWLIITEHLGPHAS